MCKLTKYQNQITRAKRSQGIKITGCFKILLILLHFDVVVKKSASSVDGLSTLARRSIYNYFQDLQTKSSLKINKKRLCEIDMIVLRTVLQLRLQRASSEHKKLQCVLKKIYQISENNSVFQNCGSWNNLNKCLHWRVAYWQDTTRVSVSTTKEGNCPKYEFERAYLNCCY